MALVLQVARGFSVNNQKALGHFSEDDGRFFNCNFLFFLLYSSNSFASIAQVVARSKINTISKNGARIAQMVRARH